MSLRSSGLQAYASPKIKKADLRARHLCQLAPVGCPGGAEHSTRAKNYFLAFAFLAFFAFFAFFAFLAIVSSQGFNGLKRDSEACLAEGQPHNILDHNPNRFAARFRVLSCRCHRVIHSCYAFRGGFSSKRRLLRPHHARAPCLTAGKRAALFINLKPRFGLRGTGESPLSAAGAICLPRQRGLSRGMPEGGASFRRLVGQQGRRGH
jgi:hypothetical protein